MPVYIGPYRRDRVVLCSGDAGPSSQEGHPCEASDFFPGANWVTATKNVAEATGCDFVILTTGHGMVEPTTVIEPYDMHIDAYSKQVAKNWSQTALSTLGIREYDILILYRGGCPDSYVPMLQPILGNQSISLLTFGRPNMYDFDKLEEVTNLVIQGTTYEELKSVLSLPERLLFYPAARSDGVGVNDMSVIVTFDKVEITDPEIGLNWAHLDLDWPGEEARDIATVKLRVPSTLHNLDEIKIYTLNRFKELLIYFVYFSSG